MAPSQKKKNVAALHAAAASEGLTPLLEISSKSDEELGRRLSAFSLKVEVEGKILPLENAFQGSKVFTKGGPYQDLYAAPPGTARRDDRLRDSGRLIAFRLGAMTFPSEPATGFYDWLYIRALYEHIEWLRPRVSKYSGFTDIEFNPEKSLNCQARSLALLLALDRRGKVNKVADDFWLFTGAIGMAQYWRSVHTEHSQRRLL